MLEVIAHEFLIVPDGRQTSTGEFEIRGEIPVFGPFHEVATDVGHVSGKPEIGHESVLVAHAQGAIEEQAVVQHAGLQGVAGGVQAARKGLEAVEPGLFGGRIGRPVLVGARREFREVDGHEVTVVEEVGPEGEQLIELGEEEVLVDGQRAEQKALIFVANTIV